MSRWLPIPAAVGLLAAALWFAGLAAAGATPHAIADPDYLVTAVLHAAYGIALAVAVGLIGHGLAVRLPWAGLGEQDVAVLAAPLGIIAVSALAVLGAYAALAGWLALALAVTLGAALVRRARPAGRIDLRLTTLAAIVALALGAHLGFTWRPATAAAPGNIDLGDLTVYTAWYAALRESLWPIFDLADEGTLRNHYFNAVPTIWALALDDLPRFDIFAFHTTTLTTFYAFITYQMLAALQQTRVSLSAPLATWSWLVAALCVVAAVRYPSWLVESPPAVLMTPFALAVGYLVARGVAQRPLLVAAMVLGGLGSALSKVVSFVTLVGYPALALARALWTERRQPRASLIVFVGLCLAYAVYMLFAFGEAFLFARLELDLLTYHRFVIAMLFEPEHVWRLVLKNAGLLIFVLGLRLDGRWLLALVGLGSVILHISIPHLFTPIPAALLLCTVGFQFGTRAASTPSALACYVMGALMMLPFLIDREPGGWSVFLLWTVTLAAIVWLASAQQLTRWAHAGAVALTAGLTLASLHAVALGKLRIGETPRTVVSSELRDIWQHARRETPADALIFTDQTGDTTHRLEGWNDYAALVGRQLYLSSWQGSPLRYDEAARLKKLEHNDAVLSARLAPSAVALSRSYSSYYAVLGKPHAEVPSSFRLRYENAAFALFEITDAGR